MSSREIIFSAAGAAGAPATYIEDVFSTWLYTGTSANQTITNGIDLAGQGGMVWLKSRSNATNNYVYDTNRGLNRLITNATNGGFPLTDGLSSFNSNGFSLGNDATAGQVNVSGRTYASWTFRKQPKFFDVVTWTGNGVSGRQIAHSLGSRPGMIFIKATNLTRDWAVCARADDTTTYNALSLNTTNAAGFSDNQDMWSSTTFTPTLIYDAVGNTSNSNGVNYVAYLFAHNAGGFGLTGTDNVISCGSFTTDGSGNSSDIDIGYQPQWLLVKCASNNDTVGWGMFDTFRSFYVDGSNKLLANSSNAEDGGGLIAKLRTRGFQISTPQPDGTYIYMAIRRGPMKTPTSGTSVFSPNNGNGSSSGNIVSSSFPIDMSMTAYRSLGGVGVTNDRLRGYGISNTADATPMLQTSSTSSEAGFAGSNPYFYNAWNNSITRGSNGADPGGSGIVTWFFGRAPGFFDVVCYTGTGVNGQTFNHNLGVIPELIIIKQRDSSNPWRVYSSPTLATTFLALNTTASTSTSSAVWNNTAPTASLFTVGTSTGVNASGGTYVAYLFASVVGVSKVGSYTGTGATQTINAGLPTGARFVLIKRTDSTGSWWVWDTARGMVTSTDPRLALNSNSAEINNDWVYTTTNGFQIVTSDATVNASGGSYIYLAIA